MMQALAEADTSAQLRRDLLVLTAICLLSWCASMWAWPLAGRDELRYSHVSLELVGRDNWLYLTYLGKAYDEKPPLAFWMGAGLVSLTGEGDCPWVLRLPSCLAALATVLLTYLIGRDLVSPRAGLVAALILIGARLFNRQAMMVRLDMIYTAFTTLALWLWLHAVGAGRMTIAQRIGFWASLAAACFTRNALVPAVILATVAADGLHLRSWRHAKLLAPVAGALTLAALLVGWVLVMDRLYPADVVSNLWYEQIVDRFRATAVHAKPMWYYLESLAVEGFGPWGLLLPFAVYHLRGREQADRRLWTLATFAGGLFVLLTLVPTKRPEYLLPAYPAMAVLVGAYLVDMADAAARPQRWRALAGAAAWTLAVAVAVTALLGSLDAAWLPDIVERLNARHLAALALSAAGFVAIGLFARRHLSAMPALIGALLCISLTYAAYFHSFRAVIIRR